jgi:N-acetylglucosaminyldiphosphoundecaprenol N-acetyl-beta-D-mannosaminyltransferase
MDEAVDYCRRLIESRGYAQHMSINAAKLVSMRSDWHLRRIIADCELVTADGQSVVWASRLLGRALPGRVAGIDLMEQLFELAEREGYRIFILGARSDVLDKALEELRSRHPRLVVAGHRDGYFDDSESEAVAAQVRESSTDILFVAMSSPKKEYWLGRHGRELGVPLVMGVGGSIDVLAGLTRRAPLLMQRLGLEWLFRLLQEPRRLLRRYLVTNTQFMLLVARELVRRLARRP